MDPAYVHLLVNHLPVFASILGGLVLARAIWVDSDDTKIAAYYVLILAAIGAVIAYFTGEGAEEKVESIHGISKEMIRQHEDSALIAFISLSILGLFSVAGIYVTVKKSSLTDALAFVTVVISMISFILVARTGFLGGQIRHTEIHSVSSIHDKEKTDLTTKTRTTKTQRK